MSDELSIRQALESRLEAWTKDKRLCLQVEGKAFTPPDGETYVRATLLWAPAVENDLCDGVTLSGVFQIDIFAASLKGSAEAGLLHGELKALFPLDQILRVGRFSVMQRSPLRIGPANTGASRHFVPTSFQFIAYT